jgi:hypothetical protein
MDYNYNGGNSAQINAGLDRVQNEFYWNGGSCVQLDALIKKVRDKIVAERLNPSPYNYGLTRGNEPSVENYIQALLNHKLRLESIFAGYSCSDKIETLRQNETAVLITKTSIDQEKNVLGSSKKEENIYIGVGAVVLLVGLIILVKK